MRLSSKNHILVPTPIHHHTKATKMGNCSTTSHKHQRHRYIPVSDDSSSNAYSPSNNKCDEAKENHNDDLLSLVGTSNNNIPSSPYLEMMPSPTTAAKSEDKEFLINHIPTQYSPIIQTPYSPIILTPPSTSRLVGAADTLALDYTKPRPQSEETIIRATHPSTPQVERLVDSVKEDEHVESTKQDTKPNVEVSSSEEMNEKVLVLSAPTEVKVTKSDTTSQLSESSSITMVDTDSKSSTIHPKPQQHTDIAVPIMMASTKKTRLVKGVRFEKSVRDNGTQQVRATNQHLSKKETDHNHQQQTLNDTRRHQNLARFALVVLLACLYMLCCGMLGWAGMKAVSSVSVLLVLDPPRMIEHISEAFDIINSSQQPTTPSLLDDKSSLLFHKPKHKARRLGMIWYKSISEELLEIDDVDNGMILI